MYVTTLPVPGMHFNCSPKVIFFVLLSLSNIIDLFIFIFLEILEELAQSD